MIGSLTAFGGWKIPGADIGDHCILDSVRLTRHLYSAPGFGVGEVWVRDAVIIQHELASNAISDSGERAGNSDELVREVSARFASHLTGVRTTYSDLPIDLDWATVLQRELARAAREIPWGEIVSYGELAALAGRPGAARAAGSFCSDNRYSLIIPCHRVVAANGIGGYGRSGVELKRRLLGLEGVTM